MTKIAFTRARRGLAIVAAAALSATLAFGAVGCSQESEPEATPDTTEETQATEEVSLEGRTLQVYCGAGMQKAFEQIAAAFETATGVKLEVTYANAAQIQTQINTTNEGDFFIAGSVEETKPVESAVASTTSLVKHIPVLVVPADNPKGITSVADLAKADRVLIGDPDSTPIGKVAKKVMTDAGIYDTLSTAGVLTTTTTAPQIATALANGEGDAGIVWKENASSDKITILDSPEMESQIKVIPAAQLTSCDDAEAAAAFLAFLASDEAYAIWANFGYERA